MKISILDYQLEVTIQYGFFFHFWLNLSDMIIDN